MKKTYSFRFWNKGGENIMVGGKYIHEGFLTEDEARSSAEALLISAEKLGAIECDIENVFYPIIAE